MRGMSTRGLHTQQSRTGSQWPNAQPPQRAPGGTPPLLHLRVILRHHSGKESPPLPHLLRPRAFPLAWLWTLISWTHQLLCRGQLLKATFSFSSRISFLFSQETIAPGSCLVHFKWELLVSLKKKKGKKRENEVVCKQIHNLISFSFNLCQLLVDQRSLSFLFV